MKSTGLVTADLLHSAVSRITFMCLILSSCTSMSVKFIGITWTLAAFLLRKKYFYFVKLSNVVYFFIYSCEETWLVGCRVRVYIYSSVFNIESIGLKLLWNLDAQCDVVFFSNDLWGLESHNPLAYAGSSVCWSGINSSQNKLLTPAYLVWREGNVFRLSVCSLGEPLVLGPLWGGEGCPRSLVPALSPASGPRSFRGGGGWGGGRVGTLVLSLVLSNILFKIPLGWLAKRSVPVANIHVQAKALTCFF